MHVREKTKEQIEAKFSKMGDYVKMDYLSSCLKNKIDFDTRKFVLVKLAGLFEARKMFSNAGEAMKSAAEINTGVQNKINDFMKAAELYIRGGNYDLADICVKKAVSYGSEKQQQEITNSVKEFYKAQAHVWLNEGKRKNAMVAYEKLLALKLDEEEKKEVNSKLLGLYENLGKIREYYALKERVKSK